jgi:CubicO group peptidase (beta-lactamase class C family)
MTNKFCSERLKRLSAAVDQEVNQNIIAGCAVAIGAADGNLFQHCAGFANIEAEMAIDSNTVFRIASMTKPITSVAIMMLLERGLFLLDDPVEKYLPEFKNMRVLSSKRDDDGDTKTRKLPELDIVLRTPNWASFIEPRTFEIGRTKMGRQLRKW